MGLNIITGLFPAFTWLLNTTNMTPTPQSDTPLTEAKVNELRENYEKTQTRSRSEFHEYEFDQLLEFALTLERRVNELEHSYAECVQQLKIESKAAKSLTEKLEKADAAHQEMCEVNLDFQAQLTIVNAQIAVKDEALRIHWLHNPKCLFFKNGKFDECTCGLPNALANSPASAKELLATMAMMSELLEACHKDLQENDTPKHDELSAIFDKIFSSIPESAKALLEERDRMRNLLMHIEWASCVSTESITVSGRRGLFNHQIQKESDMKTWEAFVKESGGDDPKTYILVNASAYKAIQQDAQPQWQPIASAPLHEYILLGDFNKYSDQFGWISRGTMFKWKTMDKPRSTSMQNPTHWQPLPKPPFQKHSPTYQGPTNYTGHIENMI